MTHPNTKIISIKPNIKGGLERIRINNPNNFDIVYNVGSYHPASGKRPATGMEDYERDILMPLVLGMESNDRLYHKSVDAYFHEINTKLGSKGIELNIGMTIDNEMGLQILNPKYDSKKDDPKDRFTLNLPLNLEDYIAYRHAKKHPLVAPNKEVASSSPICRFFIEDAEVETKKKLESTNSLREANTILYKDVVDDMESVDMYLTLMGVNTRYMENEVKVTTIHKEVANSPDRFLSVHKDANAKDKYVIMTYIQSGVLNQEGMSIVDSQTNVEIGNDLMEAVRYLRDKKNANIAKLYATRHKESIRELSK